MQAYVQLQAQRRIVLPAHCRNRRTSLARRCLIPFIEPIFSILVLFPAFSFTHWLPGLKSRVTALGVVYELN
jgi:hypothetical protein